MSDTPRTDAAERDAPWPLSGQRAAWDLCRQLERELEQCRRHTRHLMSNDITAKEWEAAKSFGECQ